MRIGKDTCELEEYMLDTIYEDRRTTKFYAEQARRIALKEENEEIQEELDLQFTQLQFGKGSADFKAKAEKLLAAYNKAAADGKEEELGENDEEFSDEEELVKDLGVSMSDVETAFNMSDETKLFQVVTSKNKKQVMRYTIPSSGSPEPLWTAKKGKMEGGVPKCERCGSVRKMEV